MLNQSFDSLANMKLRRADTAEQESNDIDAGIISSILEGIIPCTTKREGKMSFMLGRQRNPYESEDADL